MRYRYRHGDRPLEGYTIQRGIGRGGFGEVYYAVSDGGREVAIKTLLQNEEIELRGVRECINLKSPHLVAVFDVRRGEDGIAFVIMEYVSGPSLRELLEQRPRGLGFRESMFLSGELIKGLRCLHERGIVHRDLKPENIFFEDGYVKIGDYGLAKLISASQPSVQTISVGTVHYMAPEIGSGNYHRSIDIYALGVIVYELLTGRVPFTGESFGEILLKHVSASPDLEPIDPAVRPTLERALQKRPEDRFATVDEFEAGLVLDASFVPDFSSVRTQRGRSPAAPGAPGSPASAIGEESRGEPVAAPAPPRSPATPRSSPRETAPAVEPSPVAALAAAAVRRLGEGWRVLLALAVALVRIFARCISEDFAADRQRPRPPGLAARFFWVFSGSTLLAAAFGFVLAACLVMRAGFDVLAMLFLAEGAFGFSVFSFYRGLWARKRSFWRRSLRPLLATCFLNAAAISLTALLLGRELGQLRGDDLVICLFIAVGGLALFGLMLFLDYLWSRWAAIDDRYRLKLNDSRHLPRSEWPVSPLKRMVHVALGGLFTIIACILLGAAFVATDYAWDRFGFCCAAVVGATLAVYFLRQGLRSRRGFLWDGTLRPFLTHIVAGAVAICLLPVAFDLHLHPDELAVFIVIGSAAVGLGIAIALLRGPMNAPGNRG